METIDNRSFKEKALDKWGRFKQKATEVGTWVKDHPMETVGIVTLALGSVAEGRRIYDRAHEAHEDRINRTSVWCNDVQGRVRLKHELNYKENRELRDRMDAGQTKFEALDEMNLLK